VETGENQKLEMIGQIHHSCMLLISILWKICPITKPQNSTISTLNIINVTKQYQTQIIAK